MVFDPQVVLDRIASLADEDIDLGEVALALAAQDLPGISVQRYQHHLRVLGEEVGARYHEMLVDGAQDGASSQLAALKHVISDGYDYIGDVCDGNDLENFNLIRVIDRGKGSAIALGLLYICVARAQGWEITGLNMPEVFLCRFEGDGQRLIFDPFEDCRVLGAPDLRLIVKRVLGDQAELSAEYSAALSNREILVRMQDALKHRFIEDEDYTAALRIVERMRKIAPDDFRLLLDAGVLYARAEQTGAAIDLLVAYLEKLPRGRVWDSARYDAQVMLDELRGRLN